MAKKLKNNLPKLVTAAVVTINDAGKMSLEGRRTLANWLRRTGARLERDGELYARRFTARYRYPK